MKDDFKMIKIELKNIYIYICKKKFLMINCANSVIYLKFIITKMFVCLLLYLYANKFICRVEGVRSTSLEQEKI